MREDCTKLDGIEHQTLFSTSGLDRAFNAAGFTCHAKKSVMSEVHATRSYLSYQADPYLDYPDTPFREDFLFENSQESNGMDYKIQALYRLNS